MKPFVLLLLLFASFSLFAQKSINQLEKELSSAYSSKEKMIANYNLAEVYLSRDAKKAIRYSGKAFDYANKSNNYSMSASAAYIKAMANLKNRDTKKCRSLV